MDKSVRAGDCQSEALFSAPSLLTGEAEPGAGPGMWMDPNSTVTIMTKPGLAL